MQTLKGHTGPVLSVAVTPDGQRAVSTSSDQTLKVWDLEVALRAAPAVPSVQYTNAKVVLVGETSTGKTCLARALMGLPFEPQESTHGMRVWTFSKGKVKKKKEKEKEETVEGEVFLWDLAGQPEYQLVHQLFLDQTALGLILFDPTHPENPFGGVGHWEKALRRAAGEVCPKILVAGRVDRGHPTATRRDIDEFCRKRGFRRFVATSAKTGKGVNELQAATARAIPWDDLPLTSSPVLWHDMHEYLLKRRAEKHVLTQRTDLLDAFRREQPDAEFDEPEFNTVIHHAQDQGLVWRLSFGDLVLLRPELLNDYASSVVIAARKHPEGLGCVRERDVLEGEIDFEGLARLADAAAERMLLHAVVELFLSRELALRESERLVFPSKFNRERPEHPGPPLREVCYRFAGPVENIYATLVVRLFYCGAFQLKDLYKNAAEFRCAVGRICGFVLETPDEGHGEISVFFDDETPLDARVLFLRFIHEHLWKLAESGSLKRVRIYRCPKCGWEVTDHALVQRRIERGDKSITCLECDRKIALFDLHEEKFADPELLRRVREMDEVVKERKEEEVGVTTAKAKEKIHEFDVFLAHNSKDKPQVKQLAQELKRRGLNPWLDVEQIPPGRWFQDIIQQAIPKVKSAAIVIGPGGLGKWETLELRAFISRCVEASIPVIPVLLPGVTEIPKHLLFLKELNWVRFEKDINDPEALDNLQWGITGQRPDRKPPM